MARKIHILVEKVTGFARTDAGAALFRQADVLPLTHPLRNADVEGAFMQLRASVGAHLRMLQGQRSAGAPVCVSDVDQHFCVAVGCSLIRPGAILIRHSPSPDQCAAKRGWRDKSILGTDWGNLRPRLFLVPCVNFAYDVPVDAGRASPGWPQFANLR